MERCSMAKTQIFYRTVCTLSFPCTDKKENQIFLIYKEIQSEAVVKSYMRKGFLIYEEMRKYFDYYYFPIYEEAVSHIWLCKCSILNFLIYEENLIFFFISVAILIWDSDCKHLLERQSWESLLLCWSILEKSSLQTYRDAWHKKYPPFRNLKN